MRNVADSPFRTDYGLETRSDGSLGTIRAKTCLGHTDVYRDAETPQGGDKGQRVTWPVSSWQAVRTTKFNAKRTQDLVFRAQGFGQPDKTDTGNCHFLGSTYVFQNYSVGLQGVRTPDGFSSIQAILMSYDAPPVDGAVSVEAASQGMSFRFEDIVFPPGSYAVETYVIPLGFGKLKAAQFAVIARVEKNGNYVTRVWAGVASPVRFVDGLPTPNQLVEVTPPDLTEGAGQPYENAIQPIISSASQRTLSPFFSFGPGKIAALLRNKDDYEPIGTSHNYYSVPIYVTTFARGFDGLMLGGALAPTDFIGRTGHSYFNNGVWVPVAPETHQYDAGLFTTREVDLEYYVIAPSTALGELVIFDVDTGWSIESVDALTDDVFAPKGSNPIAATYVGNVPGDNTLATFSLPSVSLHVDRFMFQWLTVADWSLIGRINEASPIITESTSYTAELSVAWELEYSDINTHGPNRARAEYPDGSVAMVWAGNTTFLCVPGMEKLEPTQSERHYPSDGEFDDPMQLNIDPGLKQFKVPNWPPGTGMLLWDSPTFAPLMYVKQGTGAFRRIAWPGDAFALQDANKDPDGGLNRKIGKHLIQRQAEIRSTYYPVYAYESREAWYSAGDGCAVFFFTDNPNNTDALITGIATIDGGNVWHTRTFLNTRSMDSICLLSPGTEKEIQARIDAAREKATLGSFGPERERAYRLASFIYVEYRGDNKCQLMRMTADLMEVEEWGPLSEANTRRGLINIEGPVHPGFPGVFESAA
jgi:hypothetical protein